LITSFVMCPCHLPVTLGLLALIGGGSAFGVFVRSNGWVIGSIVTVLWLAGTARGFWLIRQADRAARTALAMAGSPPGSDAATCSPGKRIGVEIGISAQGAQQRYGSIAETA